MTIRRTPRDPTRRPGRRPRRGSPPTATGGTARRSTAASKWFIDKTRTREDGKLRIDSDGPAARRTSRRISTTPTCRERTGSASRCCTRSSRWSTTRSATGSGRVPDVVRRQALRQGAADQRRADGEDPHRRLDAGDHRAPDDQARDARAVVGPRVGERVTKRLRPAQQQRGDQRHPRLADRPPRRAVLADRGVRRRLPDAPAAAGRVTRSARSATTTCCASSRSPS